MIIKQVDQEPSMVNVLNVFPNQFKKDTEKAEPEYIKNTLDYFAHIGFAQYKRNRETFAKNYDLLKGIISWKDFYYNAEPEVKDFMSDMLANQELPEHIKHYPIMNRPINTMVGELTKRPDHHRVRAFDDESKASELEYKTQLVQQLVMQQARDALMNEVAMEGSQLEEEELEQLTVEKVQDYLTDYTSLAERWGNHVIDALKPALRMKDKAEDAFRDLLASARQFYHIYEDNSKRGFDLDTANPKNVFHPPLNDRKYTKDWYYGGVLEVMEISEIIEKIPDLTKEEIDHLVKQADNPHWLTPSKSNFESTATGIDTIKYDTYDRLVEQERQFLAAELEETQNDESISEVFGSAYQTSPISYKYAVMRVYYISKKLIGKLTYLDEEGVPQVVAVDETYQEGSPGEIDIEWSWVNQWYQGTRVGNEIYINKPFNLLDYCPIIGVVHEPKNTKARSIVDLLKPFQSIYNVALNQAWEIMEKEEGNVLVVNLRKIPVSKDGDAQDAIADWMAEARARGVVFEDDSPENMRSAGNNTNLTRNIDLNRSRELQSRMELASWAKHEAMELVGMSEQRMGGVTASESATGTQTALAQSFAQTEPYFAQHEYVLDMVYQALLDASQYIESNKPESTLSYITADGESMFLQVTGADIKLRDLHVFSTSRTQDVQLFNEIRSLSQAMLQNGASVYDIIQLYSTNSIRQMKHTFKVLKDKQEEFAQNQQAMEAQQAQTDAAIEQAKLEQSERFHMDELQMEKYKADLKANTDLATAQIKTYFQTPGTDTDGDGSPDIMEIAAHSLKMQETLDKRAFENQRLSMEMQKQLDDRKAKSEENRIKERNLDIMEKNQKNDIDIQKLKLQEAKLKLKATRASANKKPKK